MSEKKTQSQFIKDVYFSGHKNIVVAGDYVNNSTKIKIYCKTCKKFSYIRPYNLLISKQGCIYCKHITNGDRIRKTSEIFQNELDIKYKNRFSVVGNYIDNHTRIDILCLKCNKTFTADPSYLLQNGTCPICTGRELVVGVNDLWTTNPEIASLLANKEDGYKLKYKRSSKIYRDWKCPVCGKIKKANMTNIIEYGLYCDNCDDGVSYNEKAMSSLLEQLNIEYEKQKSFDNLINRRYDFYIQSHNCIIETNGLQHYKYTGLKRSLKDEIDNDEIKKSSAINSGIENYIVLDCRKSNIEWFKDSVMQSNLPSLFNFNDQMIDWNLCNSFASTSLIKSVCEYILRNPNETRISVAKHFHLCSDTIRKYVKMHMCDYEVM